MKEDFCFIYTTFSNEDDALDIADELISLHLAACCNILPKGKSVYKWGGEIIKEAEFIMIIKTGLKKYSKCKEYLESSHPYDTPIIAKIKLDDLNHPYATWLEEHITDKL